MQSCETQVQITQNDAGICRVSAAQGNAGLARVSAFCGFSKYSLTTSGSFIVNAAAGMIHGVTLNAAPTSAITLYDATVSAGAVSFAVIPAAATAGTQYLFNATLSAGIVVSAGSGDTNALITYL